MLNFLYGWNSSNKCSNSATFEQLFNHIDTLYFINSLKVVSKSGGLLNYSQNNQLEQYNDDNYTVSLIGKIYLPPKLNQNSENLATNILKLYQEFGENFIHQLKGHFLITLFDKKQNLCLIFNDIMATVPLFYSLANNNGQLIFSNHLKLLIQSPGITKNLNYQSIYNYIYFHMIPSPDTIFQNIYKLEPGQYLQYKQGEYTVSTYWQPSFSESNEVDENTLSTQLFNTLDKSVRNCIDKNNSTGSFLSGGLDSSAVTGFLAKHTDNAKSFSIGFPVDEYNEIEYARLASNQFNTKQFEYFINPNDVSDSLQKVVDSMDEPFGNSSVIPAYFCAKLAKENGITQLLAGDGGDELFAGNTRYAKQQLFERYFIVPKSIREHLIEPMANSIIGNSNFLGRKVKRYIEQANIPLPQRLETYNFLHIHSPGSVFTEDFTSTIKTKFPEVLLVKTYNNPKDASSLNRMLYLDWKYTLADNDLRKVNMMCDLAGIDVSYPMLSNEMIKLSCTIPSKLKLTPNKLRYLYKQSMNGFLPSEIINKPKHGFGLPFGVWTKTDTQLQEIAYSSISKLKSYGIFNEQFLFDTIQNHKQVHSTFYGELIWILMILGLWLDKNE